MGFISIQFYGVQFNSILWGLVQFNFMGFSSIQFYGVQFNSILWPSFDFIHLHYYLLYLHHKENCFVTRRDKQREEFLPQDLR